MRKGLRLGILVSGRGSNMESIAKACTDVNFPASVACVISNNPNAAGLSVAQSFGISTFVVNRKPLDTAALDSILRENEVDLVCLAGFMSILSEWFVERWHLRIINIHPSLLPSFKGLRAQEQAFLAGVKVAGCTIHYVYPKLDSGPIIMQAAVPVFSCDSVDTLSARILEAEHICYPKAIRLIASGNLSIEEDDTVKYSGKEELFLFHNPK